MKKAIVFSLICTLLVWVIAPSFANAMGSSSMSTESVLIFSAVVIIATVAIIHYTKKSDQKADTIDVEQLKKTAQKNTSKSGELVLFRW